MPYRFAEMVDIAHARSTSETEPRTTVSAALFDPSDAAFLANPYPTYDRLRAEDPVHRTPLGLWVLTRYDDVALVLRDPRFSREGLEAAFAAVDGQAAESDRRQPSMLYRDPPDHTRLRAVVSRTFTPRAMEATPRMPPERAAG